MDEIYPPTERQIFRYWNGQKAVCGDPIEIYDRLVYALSGDLDGTYERMAARQQVPGPDGLPLIGADGKAVWEENLALSFPARQKMREAVRFAFSMAPFNPDAQGPADLGATAGDCDKALEDFEDFCGGQKKSGGPPPTCPTGSDPPPPASAEDPLTGLSSASG